MLLLLKATATWALKGQRMAYVDALVPLFKIKIYLIKRSNRTMHYPFFSVYMLVVPSLSKKNCV